jgi:hypothetical protein
MIDATSRTSYRQSMLDGLRYDKVKVGQNANRGARNTCASKAEAARLDLTPTAPAAYAERPAVDRVFRKGPPLGGFVPETLLSPVPSLAERLDGCRSQGGCDGS